MVQITMDEHGNIAAWATDVHDNVVFDGFNKVIAEKDAKIELLRDALQCIMIASTEKTVVEIAMMALKELGGLT